MKKIRKTRKIKIEFCFALILAVCLICAIINQQPTLNSNAKVISDLTEQKAQAEKAYSELDDTAAECSSDEFVERIARDRLGLVRPDETVFIDVTNE